MNYTEYCLQLTFGLLGNSPYMKEKKVLLLEGGQCGPTDVLKNLPEFHSNRVCAISPGNVQLLDSLNIWKKIPRSCSVKKMQVSQLILKKLIINWV